MAIFISLKEQISNLSSEANEVDVFYQKITFILFRLTVFLIAPILFIGSYFFFLDGYPYYGIVENISGFFLIGFIYFYKPNLAVKRVIILLFLYAISIFVLLTTGISGGGFTSVMMSIILVFLLTKKYQYYWIFLVGNFLIFTLITILLYTGFLDQIWIVTYKQTWPFLVAMVNVYSLVAMLTISFYKRSLEESGEKYHTLHDTMIQGVVYQDSDGYILSCNPATEEILGLSLSQMQGKTSMDPRWKMIDEDGNSISGENHPAMIALRTKEKVGPVVRGVYHPDSDTYVWLNIIAIPLFKDDDEKPYQVYATLEDITERKLILDQLKRKEKQLLDSQIISQVGSFRLDLITNEIEWTDEVYKMFGFDPTLAAIPYEEQVKTYTKESWEKLSNAVDLTATKGIGYSLELEIVRQDGSNGWIWVKGEAEKDKQGEIIAILGVAQDITERKEQEEKLKQSEEQYRLLTSEMQLGLSLHEIICDDNGKPIDYRFISVNESYEILTGLKKEDIIGKTVLEVLPKIEEVWIEIYGKVALTGESTKFEDYSTELGKYFSVSAYCPKKGQFATVVDDITEKRKQEELVSHSLRYDSLTEIPNRVYYDEKLSELNSEKNYPLAIILMDINGLKLINDSFGQDAGNTVLKQFSNILSNIKRKKDFVARISGDEFIMLSPKTSSSDIIQLKENLLDKISKKRINNIEYSIAIGFAIKETKDQDITKIVIEAENAMYKNKITYGQSTRSAAIESVFSTLTNKYVYEKRHSETVAKYSRQIGEHLNLREDELDELELAGRLHDIGKIAISDDILRKPGKLNNEEWEKIKDHTAIGYQILRAADKYSNLAEYALSHHERMDGKGYPNGLEGKDIPLFSRIICVADAYEAMTSKRVYKAALDKKEAIKELEKCSGTQFDPKVIDVFINKVLLKDKER